MNEVVHTAWEKAKLAGLGPSLADRTKAVHADLHTWDRDILKAPKKRVNKLKKELEKLRRGISSSESIARQKEILFVLENIMEQEEIFWLQRGRADWLLHGDKNTKFFHNAATARKKRNCIKKLLDDTGVWREGNDQLKDHIIQYFSNLFTAEVDAPDEPVISTVKRCVSQEMNDALMAPYSAEEVKKALFDIGDLKAPGPDGLHAIFYKRFWPMLGEDLVDEVLKAVNSCSIPQGWNDTAIVMIPKINSPEKVTQFRPISLCNVVYKVISKMLAAHLKVLLPDIISPT